MAAPVKISPLIRTARWCLISAGVFYGFKHRADIRDLREEERVSERRNKVEFLADIKKKKELANAEFERTSILFGHTAQNCQYSRRCSPDDPPPSTGRQWSEDETEAIFGSFNIVEKSCPCGLPSCGQKSNSSGKADGGDPASERKHVEDLLGFCTPTSNVVYEEEDYDDDDDDEDYDYEDGDEEDHMFHDIYVSDYGQRLEREEDDDDAMKYGNWDEDRMQDCTFREFIQSKYEEHQQKKHSSMKGTCELPPKQPEQGRQIDIGDAILDSFRIEAKPCSCGNPDCGKLTGKADAAGLGSGRSCGKIHLQSNEGFCTPIEEVSSVEEIEDDEEEGEEDGDVPLCGAVLGEPHPVDEVYDMEKKTCGSKSSCCYRCDMPLSNDAGNPDCFVCGPNSHSS